MSTTERKLDFRDKRRETEQIKSAHEKRRPGAQPSLLFCPSWAETTYFADQTTKAQPIERCAFNNAAKPNRSHDAIDNATKPNQTHRATDAAPKPNSPRGAAGHAVNTAPPAQQPTRRHRPHAPEPHAHRATDEYPGPSSARSRASPSRARGTHRRARARSPRPRRPAAPRTPARAHASSR